MKNLNIINVIKNDYFSGSYEFKIELSTQGTSSDKCSDIKPATAETSEVMEKIITCTYSDKSCIDWEINSPSPVSNLLSCRYSR